MSDDRPNAFVEKTLGPWSSHPDMMARQKRVLWWVGMLPFVVAGLAVLMIVTGYRASDFSAVHDWQTFLAACAKWWGKIKWSVLVFALAGCMTAGFMAMSNLLWMVGVTLGRWGIKLSERDRLPFPAALVGLGVLCWLVPVATWAMRGVFTAVDWRLNLVIQLVSNFLCLFPLALLMVWTKWVRRFRSLGPDEEIHRPVSHLLVALLLFAACAAVLVLPKPGFFDGLVERWFPWLAQCGIDPDQAYGWARLVLAACLGIGGVFHFIVWRLRTEIRPKKKRDWRKQAAQDEEVQDKQDHAKDEIPAGARMLLANLPEGVRAEPVDDRGTVVCRRKVREQSPYQPGGGDAYGLGYLLGGDIVPTEDQTKFFLRFVEAYDGARRQFGERTDFKEDVGRKNLERADMLLLGEDGSGRTEILLAAALYAAVVRGQRVLFLCADPGGAEKLKNRVQKRLEWLGVDVYVSADKLRRNELDRWLDPMRGTMPPDMLFSTPETAENLFFANPATRKRESAAEMRTLLTGFGAVFVDDFLDMPPSFRAHTAFLLDKMKLLQASEPVLAQYVVAATPMQKPDGAEGLGARLFGAFNFDREKNILELKPRPYGAYWFGTLRVDAKGDSGDDDSKSLKRAVKDLVKISADGGCQTLLYQKGMSSDAKKQFLDDCGGGKDGGGISVASRYRELEELEKIPDNVFYLSLTCGDAGTALRLNLEGGEPVFFRIALEGEEEPEAPVQYGLIPDETALSLRVHHLRNVLQFIGDHIPVPDEAWERFQITKNHPCIRELAPGSSPGTVAVSWLHDELTDDSSYGANALWPYLVLETPVAYGAGMDVDFNVLPVDRGRIWKDVRGQGKLLLADSSELGEKLGPGHLAIWRDGSHTIGESDLSHADELVYVGADEYTVKDALCTEGEDKQRYALLFRGQYRHGGDTEFIHPVRRLSWKVPLGELKVSGVQGLDEVACFPVERETSATCRVDGTLVGRINLRGKTQRNDPLDYCYDAYLSCVVLLPTFGGGASPGGGAAPMAEQAKNCLDGAWATDAACGFSSALTHAFAAALRRKIADWPFYAVAPLYFTEGREESIGRATMWIVEPSSSGRTVQPRLVRLMQEKPAFRHELYAEAKKVLESCTTLAELRLASRLAFAGETDPLDEDDKRKALELLDTLLDKERSEEWTARRLRERDEACRKRKERKTESRSSAAFTPEEREFEKVVLEALTKFADTIDVSKSAVELGWDYDKISDLFNDVLWNHPEVFWVAKRGRYQWWADAAGKVTRFVITDLPYAFAPEEFPRKKAEFDAAVGQALSTVSDGADPVTKALQLHDHIVTVCDYDMEAKKRHDQSPLARTAYSVLVRHSAVCEGYAMAYRYLLDKMGIRSEEVLSDKMNHCWNYVEINGKWYHVDVTWDDPVYVGKNPGTAPVLHDYFLLSDAAMRARDHEAWDVRGLPPATDTTYDNRKWDNAPGKGKNENGEPWDLYKEHPLFRAKGSGNVKHCRGKIHLRVFFVDDEKCSWTDKTRNAYRAMVDDAIQTLERERGLGSDLAISWSAENLTMAGSFSKGNDAHDAVPALLGVSGKADVAKLQNSFRKSHGYEEVPMLFVWAWDFRGSAKQSQLELSARRTGEWATIGVDDILKNRDGEKRTFLHELLHLFGAEDFYYPPTVEKAAEKWLPGSIMNEGDAIDDLTRVLIGWDDHLSCNAEGFLDDTKDVTEKEIDEAAAAEWKKKWN